MNTDLRKISCIFGVEYAVEIKCGNVTIIVYSKESLDAAKDQATNIAKQAGFDVDGPWEEREVNV